mgnify:FL=1|tara:strand:+ start:95 stop:271 length:177 start_codon:yes stop_codon:yes gene_type:complete
MVMRVLLANYGDVRIFYDRPFGYKRYHVNWGNGQETMFSGLWYREKTILKMVEDKLDG